MRGELTSTCNKATKLGLSKSGSYPKMATSHGSSHEPWFGLAQLAQFGQATAELSQTEPSRAVTALLVTMHARLPERAVGFDCAQA